MKSGAAAAEYDFGATIPNVDAFALTSPSERAEQRRQAFSALGMVDEEPPHHDANAANDPLAAVIEHMFPRCMAGVGCADEACAAGTNEASAACVAWADSGAAASQVGACQSAMKAAYDACAKSGGESAVAKCLSPVAEGFHRMGVKVPEGHEGARRAGGACRQHGGDMHTTHSCEVAVHGTQV